MRNHLLNGLNGYKPYGDYPTKEPQEVTIGTDAGKVVINVGEGTLLFDPQQARLLGLAIVEEAEQCMKRTPRIQK
jgi:hypothetical protein